MTVSQSNSRFNALDILVVFMHSVKMTVEFPYGTALRNGIRQENYREYEGRGKLFNSRFNNSDAKEEKDAYYISNRQGRKMFP